MDEQTAKQVDQLARQAQGNLNELIHVVQTSCTQEEFEQIRMIVGKIMGAIVVDVLQPLYRKHPAIVPPELQ